MHVFGFIDCSLVNFPSAQKMVGEAIGKAGSRWKPRLRDVDICMEQQSYRSLTLRSVLVTNMCTFFIGHLAPGHLS